MADDPSILWEEFKKSGDPTALMAHYSPFTKQVAYIKYTKLPSFVLYEDIESSAMVGLWMAIERFDPDLGVPFESFARQRIQGNILDDIREEDHSSRTTRDLQKSLAKIEKDYQTRLRRSPTTKEMAEELGVTEGEAMKLKVRVQEATLLSLNADYNKDGDGPISRIDSVTGVEDDIIIYEQDLLSRVMSTFTKRERLLFALIYFEGLTLDQAAPIMGLTHPMVCQCHFRLSDRLERQYDQAKKA